MIHANDAAAPREGSAAFPHVRARMTPVRFIAWGLAAALSAIAPTVYAQLRVAVVDVRRAVAETAEGRAAFTAIKARFDERQSELDRRSKVLEGLKRQFDNPARLTPARAQKIQSDYLRLGEELQRAGQQYTAEVQYLEGTLSRRILEKLQPVMREVGQTDNIQMVVDQSITLFARGDLDLTDRVIQLYNERNPWPASRRVELPEVPNLEGAQQGPGGSPMSPSGVGPSAPPPSTAPAGAAALGLPEDGARPTGSPSADADAGARLPGVFFRRDAGR